MVSDNETLIAKLNFTSSMTAAVYYNDEGKWVGDGCEVSLFYAHNINSIKTLKYRKEINIQISHVPGQFIIDREVNITENFGFNSCKCHVKSVPKNVCKNSKTGSKPRLYSFREELHFNC